MEQGGEHRTQVECELINSNSILQGASMLAIKYLFNRFSYSLVWCNLINCVGIQDKALGSKVRLDLGKV